MAGKGVFNFYQYSYTGQLESSGYVVIPTINGLFTGFFTPEDILAGLTGYEFALNSELFLNPPTFSTQFIGSQISANNDKPNLSLNFNGNFIPFVKESGYFSFNFNGGQSGQSKDTSNFITNFSGNQFGQTKDTWTYSLNISGNYGSDMSDRPNLSFYFNASQSGQLKDTPSFSFNFTGSFQKPIKDYAYLNFSGQSITWSAGNLIDTFNFNDCANTSFQPIRITWSPTA